MPTSQLLHILIRNREKIVFEGDAKAITSVNDRGVFDILPQHINFISMIKERLLIYKPDGTKQEYKVRTGLMRVSNNTIEVYVGIVNQQSTPSNV